MNDTYDAWLTIFADHQVATVLWTWYAVPAEEGCVCSGEQVIFRDGRRVPLSEIAAQELYETIWEISAETRDDLDICAYLGVFRLDVATRTVCKIADVGNWEDADYDWELNPGYTPSIDPLPADQQPCCTI